MDRIKRLIYDKCPHGVTYAPLWSVTYWDKKFKGIDKAKQRKVISYPYLLADDLFALQQETGDVFLRSTGEKTGWTTELLAGANMCEGEVVSIPWGKSRPVSEVIKYYKGKFVTADNRIATSSDTSVLRNKFLYYWMLSQGKTIDRFYRGDGLKHPSMKSVLDMEIPLPPIDVQDEVIQILDELIQSTTALISSIDAELSDRKKQFEFYRNLIFEKYLYDVEPISMIDVCSKTCSGGTPKSTNSSYYGGDIPWLRTQEVDWKDIYDTEIKITEEGLANSSAKMIPENCVIVAMYGATAAKSAINKISLTTNQACCNLQIDPQKARYQYVFYWLCKEYKKLKALGRGSQHNINADMIKSFPIQVPSLCVQDSIITALVQYSSIELEYEQTLRNEADLRKTVLEYYISQLLDFDKNIGGGERMN